MGKVLKIAISLPADILAAVERVQRERGQTRSEFFRSAVEHLLQHERERAAVARYLQGYRDQPETVEEIGDAALLGGGALAQEPW